MRNLLILSTLALLILLGGCGGSDARYPYAKEPDPRKQEFVIGVSDHLRIAVWKNPELNTDIQVRPDGTITMPLIGDIQASGLTPSQLKRRISDKLAAFIKEEGATITVAITEVSSYRVVVSGNVTQPGIFSSKSFLTVADAIALAGGPNRFANASNITLVRKAPTGEIRRIPIDYNEILSGEGLDQNLVLMSGDTILVP